MDEFNLMIPEGYEASVNRVFKDHDSWDNVARNQVDVTDLFDSYDDEDEHQEDEW